MFVKHVQSRLLVTVLSFALATPLQSLAADAHNKPQNYPSGLSWVMQAMAALTGGNSVTSVTESGTVTRTLGGDQQQGSITLQSPGLMANQISLSLPRGTLSETRSWQNSLPAGTWTGFDGVQHPMAQHNCWTDAVWFFPALSLLADYADPNLVFTDLGQQQYQGGSVEHIQVYRTVSGLSQYDLQVLAMMSTVDYYLDSQTALPVGMAFSTHADNDLNVGIPVVLVFTGYTSVSGVQVPMQVVKVVNGTTVLQISVANVSLSY
jgi:hypothetical protein